MNQIKIRTKNGEKAIPELQVKNIKTSNIENSQDEEIIYLQFPGLAKLEEIKHIFSTRLGGVSQNEFASMNLSFTRGDEEESVQENYRRIAKVMGCEPEDMVATYQTHTKNLRIVTKSDCGNGVTKAKSFFDIDGLITNEPGVVILAYFADCVPIYLVDPVKKVIALCHSGWKGTVLGIAHEAIIKMNEEFDCSPGDIYAAIGPSICKECYEVSEDLLIEFKENYWDRFQDTQTLLVSDSKEDNTLFWNKGNGKYHLDLWKANELILIKSGILPEHIETTNVCTCCNSELLFSHRASDGKRGNLCAFLSIKEK